MRTKNRDSIPEMINRVNKFVEKNNRLPFVSSKDKDEKQLASWCYTAKFSGNTLNSVHHKRLSAIPGWKWDFWDERDFFTKAKAFDQFTKNNFRLPKNSKTATIEEKALHTWANKVRELFEHMPPEWQQQIKEITYWDEKDFDNANSTWENAYFRYYDFVFNNRKPPALHRVSHEGDTITVAKSESNLATWANLQKIEYQRGNLDTQSIYLLNRIPFWNWSIDNQQLYSYDDYYDQFHAWTKLRGIPPQLKTTDPIERTLAIFAQFYELKPQHVPRVKSTKNSNRIMCKTV